MPNHVENTLVVYGDREDKSKLAAFVAAVKGDEAAFDCSKVIPYPAHFKEMDRAALQWEKDNPGKWDGRPRDGFNSGGYEWCIQNWGTKWGVYEVNDHGDDSRHYYHFRSAWSPPLPVIRKAAELWPGLEFELNYYECGMEKRGVFMLTRDDNRVLQEHHEHGEYIGRRGG